MKELIKNELTGWTFLEVTSTLLVSFFIAALSVYWGDNLMGIVSAVSGVLYVIFTGKGKLLSFFFGIINSLFYAIISYKASYYGEAMLNGLYYFPMQFVGFFIWKKNIDQNTHEVKKQHMSKKGRVILILAIAVATYLYGLVLKHLGDAMPFVDSFTTVSSVICLIISIKMFSEQWWIWAVVDIFSVYMWWIDFRQGNGNIATLLMWVVYVVLAFVMLYKWEKEAYEKKEMVI